MPFQRQRAELRIDDGMRLGTGADQPFPNGVGAAARGTCETTARLRVRRADIGDCAVAEHEPSEGIPVRAQGSCRGCFAGHWTICHVRGRPVTVTISAGSRARGWWLWRAASLRSWVTPRNCGRCDVWPSTPGGTVGTLGIRIC